MIVNNLAVIPARGGSKGIKNKNICLINGKPLIAHAILCAQEVSEIDKIVVSTDSELIAAVAEEYGAEVHRRSYKNSQDNSLVIDTIREVVTDFESKEYVVKNILLVEATSPIRFPCDLSKSIMLINNENIDSVASFSKSDISPNRLWSFTNDEMKPYLNGADPWQLRQNQPVAYELNGVIYALKVEVLKEHPQAVSLLLGNIAPLIIKDRKVVDIDEPADLLIAEALMQADMV